MILLHNDGVEGRVLFRSVLHSTESSREVTVGTFAGVKHLGGNPDRRGNDYLCDELVSGELTFNLHS